MLVLQNLDTCAGLEHHDDMALVQDVGGRVDGDTGEVLDLLWVSVEVDVATVHEDVKLVPPLSVKWPQSHLRSKSESNGLSNDNETFLPRQWQKHCLWRQRPSM